MTAQMIMTIGCFFLSVFSFYVAYQARKERLREAERMRSEMTEAK
jgi:hypothetical protein